MAMSNCKLLQFAPFTSAFDAGFWYQLSDEKLNKYKLEDKPIHICGFYTYSQSSGIPPIANLDYTAFNEDLQVPPRSFPLHGVLCNTNTLDDFKNKDVKAFVQSVGQEIWDAMKTEEALSNPTLIQKVACITFADLKKFHFYYWICFPAFTYPETSCLKSAKCSDHFNKDQMLQLLAGYDTLTTAGKMGFIVSVSDDGFVNVSSLKDFKVTDDTTSRTFLAFSDPSSLDSHPGWPLRNLLTLAAIKWGNEKDQWDVLCFRENFKDGVRSCNQSLILTVKICSPDIPQDCPVVVGLEKNQKGQLAPRTVNMSKSMDPTKLAEASVDLNLKLMKWRLLPDLDLDVIKDAKCLLLGSGTLGCNVARSLLGWGVKKITFVDNSNVSFSNPVRQTLFTFDDCMKGGKSKALAAAEALKKIYPLVDCEGINLSIPMPGHSLTTNTIDEVRKEVTELEKLIDSHDVVFLLMDTRESRWLPTLLGKLKQKIVLNAALGFETFLVMRHGTGEEVEAIGDANDWKVIPGGNLGCYFCNDVVIPGNSLQDRTLDQQCTVTRPGVSFTAAALAVEMMVSILQHPMKGSAPATTDYDHSDPNVHTPLGIIPHQVRGYLDRFQNVLHLSKSFDRCTACSKTIIENYQKEGFDFLLKVFNEIDYLGAVTGLTDLLKNVNVDDVLILSDDDSC